MLDHMLTVIRGMVDTGKLGALHGAIVQRLVELTSKEDAVE
jgi:hypothetical protein